MLHDERNALVFHTKKLTIDTDILEAKFLLYQVYVEEFKWKIPSKNPSEIRVEASNGLYFLQDMFDSVANWFGVFHDKKLVGCIRGLRPLNGIFELEYYRPLPTFLKDINNLVENNRLAIKKEYRGTKAIYELSIFAIEYELNLGMVSSFGTAPFPGYGSFYIEKLGYEKLDIAPFKYHPSDREYVNLMHLDLSDSNRRREVLFEIRAHLKD